jgi:hypothetical protein
MIQRRCLTLGFFAMFAMAACVSPPKMDYTRFIDENPRSILIVPVLDNSPEVGADEYFLATITVPLAERGYYVFPVHMSRELLAEAGLSDPGLVHQAEPTKLGRLFDADSILYVTINNWEAKYLVLSTTVTVAFNYALVSGKTGEMLWEKEATINYSPQAASSGHPIADLVVMAVQAAATKAMPNYIPLARQANWAAVSAVHVGQGQRSMMLANPMIYGPYHELYRSDWGTGEAAPTPPAQAEKPAEAAEPASDRKGSE